MKLNIQTMPSSLVIKNCHQLFLHSLLNIVHETSLAILSFRKYRSDYFVNIRIGCVAWQLEDDAIFLIQQIREERPGSFLRLLQLLQTTSC